MMIVDAITGRTSNGGLMLVGYASAQFNGEVYQLDYSAGGAITIGSSRRVIYSVSVLVKPLDEATRNTQNPRMALRVYRKAGGSWPQTPVAQTDVYSKPAWNGGAVASALPVVLTFYFSNPIYLEAFATYGFFIDPSTPEGTYRICSCTDGSGYLSQDGATMAKGVILRSKSETNPTNPNYQYETFLSLSYPMIRLDCDQNPQRIFDAISTAGGSFSGGWLLEGNKMVVNDLGQMIAEDGSIGSEVTTSSTQYVVYQVEAMFSPRNAAALAIQHPQFVLKIYKREKYYIPETRRYYMAWTTVAQSSVYTKPDWTGLAVPKLLTFQLLQPLVLVANTKYYVQVHLYDSIQVGMAGTNQVKGYASVGEIKSVEFYVFGGANQKTNVAPQNVYLFNLYGNGNYSAMSVSAYEFPSAGVDNTVIPAVATSTSPEPVVTPPVPPPPSVPEPTVFPGETEEPDPTFADAAPDVDPWNPPIAIPIPFKPYPVGVAPPPYFPTSGQWSNTASEFVQAVEQPPAALPSDNIGKTIGVYDVDPDCMAVTCCGDDEPVANYSSDHPERETFVAMAFFADPTTPGSSPCVVPAVTTVSDEYSKAVATFSVKRCAWEYADVSKSLICSDAQSCSAICPDGTSFTHTVPAGSVCDDSKDRANAIAAAICQLQVNDMRVCFGLMGSNQCSDEIWCAITCPEGGTYNHRVPKNAFCGSTKYDANVSAIAACYILGLQNRFCIDDPPCSCQDVAYSWDVAYIDNPNPLPSITVRTVTGLPAGLALVGNTIQGTPTESGSFDVYIEAVDADGNWAERIVTLKIISITDDSALGTVTSGVLYTHVFTCAGCGAFENRWALVSGSLPPGLTLDDTGVLHGTPTTAGNYTFEIGVPC